MRLLLVLFCLTSGMMSANVNIYFMSMIFSEKSLPEKFYSFCLHICLKIETVYLKSKHLQFNYPGKSYEENVCKRTWPTIILRIPGVGCRVKDKSIYRRKEYYSMIFFALKKVFFKSGRVQIEIVCAIVSV